MKTYKEILRFGRPVCLLVITGVFMYVGDSGNEMICIYLVMDYVYNNF